MPYFPGKFKFLKTSQLHKLIKPAQTLKNNYPQLQKTLKIRVLFFILLVVPILLFTRGSDAATGINSQLNYQGKLADSGGTSVADDTYNAKFVIYDSLEDGNCLWTAVGACDTSSYGTTTLTTVDGIFSVALGDTGHNLLTTSSIDWNDDSLYLGVTIRGTDASPVFDSEMTPRRRLTSVAYAFNAGLVDGLSATSTANVASQLLSLDADGNFNLYLGGVSSTAATTSDYLYFVPQETAPDTIEGRTYYSSDDNTLYIYNGSGWQDALSGGGAGASSQAWEQIWTGAISPTTTAAGIYITSSSTIDYLKMTSATTTNATTTNRLYVQTDLAVATTTPWEGYELAVTGDIAASGNLEILGGGQFGRATSTDRLYVTTDLAVATTTPWAGYELAVTGDIAASGNLEILGYGQFGRSTTTGRLYVNTDLAVVTTTPAYGFELAVTGDGIFSGGINVDTLTVNTSLDLPADSVTDAMLVDTITASSYMPLAGGTFTGNVTMDGSSNLYFANGTTYYVDPAGAANFLRATSSDRLYVTTDLAVATTTPFEGYELAVAGNAVIGGNLKIFDTNTAGNNNLFEIYDTGGLVAQIGKATPSDAAGLDLYDESYNLAVRLHTQSGQYSWINSGNFGLGTSDPYYQLEISDPTATTTLYVVGGTRLEGSVTTTDYLMVGSGTVNNLDYSAGDLYVQDDLEIDGQIYSASPFHFTTAGDNYVYFDNATTNYLAWDDSEDEFDLSNDLNITGAATTSGHFEADSTLYVKDGIVNIGTEDLEVGLTGQLNVVNQNGNTTFVIKARTDSVTQESELVLMKSRDNAGVDEVVQNGDNLGIIIWRGYDGDQFGNASYILGVVDGAPGDDDMPGRLGFFTSPDGSKTSLEAMRIDSNQNISIGSAATPAYRLEVSNPSATTTLYVVGGTRLEGSVTTTEYLMVGSGTVNNLDYSAGDLYVQDDLEVDGQIYSASPFQFTTAGDNYVYFDNATTNYLAWDDTNDEFDLSNDLNITGAATTSGHLAADATLYVKDGNVGIGMANPTYKTDIFNQSITTAATNIALRVRTSIETTSNSDQGYWGGMFSSLVEPSNTNDFTLGPRGMTAYGYHYGSGSVGYAQGGVFYAGTGDTVAGGSITNVQPLRVIHYSAGGGAIENNQSIYINNPTVGGSLTNNYAIYIEDQTSATNDYGLYVEGADTNSLYVSSGLSYFGGNVGINTTVPYYALEVSDPTATTTLYIVGGSRFEGSVTTTDYLMVGNGSVDNLDFSAGDLYVQDDLEVDGQIYSASPFQFTTAGDNFIYFDNATTNYLAWDDGSDEFDLSNDLNITGAATTSGHFEADSTLYIKDNSVGVGIEAPQGELHVAASDNPHLTIEDTDGGFTSIAVGANSAFSWKTGTTMFFGERTAINSDAWESGSPFASIISGGHWGLGTIAPAYQLEVSDPTATTTLYVVGNTRLEGKTTTTNRLWVNDGSLVGPAWNDIIDKMIVEADAGQNVAIQIFSDNDKGGNIAFADNDGRNRGVVAYNHADDSMTFYTASTERMKIGLTATATNAFWAGSGGITNNVDMVGGDIYVQDDLEVDGSIFGTVVDLAERINSNDPTIEAGDVVIIDINNPESVVKSTTAYNNLVAGVISTDPGILLGSNDTGVPLTLAGRVPTKVSTENGNISIGDLLTTSDTPGYAMKATDSNAGILGIALENFTGSTGEMIVLVRTGASLAGQVQPMQGNDQLTLDLADILNDSNQIENLVVTDTLATQRLVVEDPAQFNGTITVIGEAGFESKVTFRDGIVVEEGDLEIKSGKLIVDSDTAGTVLIKTNATSTQVLFESAYTRTPVVTLTPVGDAGSRYWLSDVNKEGFRINILQTIDSDINFNWMALAIGESSQQISENIEPPEEDSSPQVQEEQEPGTIKEIVNIPIEQFQETATSTDEQLVETIKETIEDPIVNDVIIEESNEVETPVEVGTPVEVAVEEPQNSEPTEEESARAPPANTTEEEILDISTTNQNNTNS